MRYNEMVCSTCPVFADSPRATDKATTNEISRPKFFVFSKEATNPGKEVLSGLRDLQEKVRLNPPVRRIQLELTLYSVRGQTMLRG